MVETAAGFTASRDFHPSQVLCELPPLLAAVAGQEYHCVLTASWQNNPPQAAFRTDGPARHLILAVVDGRRRRNPKNESWCFLVYSALPQVSPSASSGIACPGFRGPSGKVFQPSDILFSSCSQGHHLRICGTGHRSVTDIRSRIRSLMICLEQSMYLIIREAETL